MRIAFLLWAGTIGGAEIYSLSLAGHLRRRGVDVSLLFVCDVSSLRSQLDSSGVPYETLSLRRGGHVLMAPRRLVEMVRRAAPDGVIVGTTGYLSALLRLGGYRGQIIGVEHGAILQWKHMGRARRLIREIDRFLGILNTDVEVAVSDCILTILRSRLHAHRLVRIYNGVDVGAYVPGDRRRSASDSLVVGCVGRLIPGKGVDILLRAMAEPICPPAARLVVAGDGPCREEFKRLAFRMGLRGRVEFLGWIDDVSTFWRSCDVAVVPSFQLLESFGVVAIEAMALGLPVIATDQGGLREVVEHGVTGILTQPGSPVEISVALAKYSESPTLLLTHGQRGRERCARLFSLQRAADEFLGLLATESQYGSPDAAKV